MRGATAGLVMLGLAAALSGTLPMGVGRTSTHTMQQEKAASGAEREQMLATGKKIFVEKCAKCHGDRGDKELSSGKPLSQRGLGKEAISKAVNGRLSKGTDEDRRAVTLYVESLMKG